MVKEAFVEHDVLSLHTVRIVANLNARDALSIELPQRLVHIHRWEVDRAGVHSDRLLD